MTLRALMNQIPYIEAIGDPNTAITHVTSDSRAVRPGSLFVCIRGYVADGHDYIAEAINRGASAVALERPIDNLSIPWIRTENTRATLALVSAALFGHPADKMTLVGVTGTKGKTTITFMIQTMLEQAGKKAGLIGTVFNIIGNERQSAKRTTPESAEIQAMLADMLSKQQMTCVMEVSSQGLMLDRVLGCYFKVGLLTNLYRDHISPTEHRNMDEYLTAKLKLYDLSEYTLINRDAEIYDEVVARIGSHRLLSYGCHPEAPIQAVSVEQVEKGGRIGTQFTLELDQLACLSADISPEVYTDYVGQTFFVGMPGEFNVSNALASISVALFLKIPCSACQTALERISVPGRVQVIPTKLRFQVIVDYAHNAASLEHLLVALRSYVTGRLILVFGNGGDRARDRRFEMGEVAGRLADLTIITSDNPRSEDPAAIIQDIVTGIEPTDGSYLIESDRASAIRLAIESARTGDMVIIAGKGHENYQIFADRTIHFDDAEIAADVLRDCERPDDSL